MNDLARTPLPPVADDGFVTLEGEPWLVIRDVDRLPPFLMSVVSPSDHWLYVSSRGGLTAGRGSAAGALFPYVTDDKLHVAHAHTGPRTVVRVGAQRWEPFHDEVLDPGLRRHLYKSQLGHRVRFEEVHEGLGLTFVATWETSEAFGFVRTARLVNHGPSPVQVELLDGLRDLMPAAAAPSIQQGASCLVNAYTRADVDPVTGLALVSLQALIVDRPVPAESLRATTLFCTGLERPTVLLSDAQLPQARRGLPVQAEPTLTGRRASYLVSSAFSLGAGQTRQWRIVADVDRDHLQVEALRATLASKQPLDPLIDAEVRAGGQALWRIVGSADGLQATADRRVTVHHYANTLFNSMRGGVFADGHTVDGADFQAFVGERNRVVAATWRTALEGRSGPTPVRALLEWAAGTGDLDLLRLAHEYLPLTFSRRHGDPSRPWNAFSIRVRNADGSRALDYQGNWRDIFQNWEALCLSHPDFLESVIAVFVDASTVDGFNPYRLSRAGIDWEVPEVENPWSTIGYWGDHQIVYLTRLLEALERTRPGRLATLLGQRWFTFADVPYRLASAEDLARTPRSTITFDRAADRAASARVARLGGDGRLKVCADGELVRVSLLEKLLVPVLAKLANLVLDGGVWLNTQRPEWNDANNALVGNGLSVVTLGQLRRHLVFLQQLCEAPTAPVELSSAVSAWLTQTVRVLARHQPVLAAPGVSDTARRTLLDELQLAFEAYRLQAYGAWPSATVPIAPRAVADLCRLALGYVDHSLRANRRPDGLFHSYNLLRLTDGVAEVAPLYEMLEGQVSVLSSGLLNAEEALALIDALFASRLFRADQQSFLLYPNRSLPGFLEKNRVTEQMLAHAPALAALLELGASTLIARDVHGVARFAGHLQTTDDVRRTVEALGRDARFAAHAQVDAVVATFEQVFDLAGFTGRSGTMYGYEGLGCIYWHMVSKLLVAVQELGATAHRSGAPRPVVERLAAAYDRVRAGLGFNTSAEHFGAFPTDPYSHTPAHAGAQQPGMTGSVKEELVTRFGELGVELVGGRVRFDPWLLSRAELLTVPTEWAWASASTEPQRRVLEPGELGFTLCQVPVIYRAGAARELEVTWASGQVQRGPELTLDEPASRAVLGRTGEVTLVRVTLPLTGLRGA